MRDTKGRMNKKGLDVAFSSIVYAILAVVVIIVLILIFRDRVITVLGVEDPCGEGLLNDHQCYWERPSAGAFCFEVRERRCETFASEPGDSGARDHPLCCRVS